MKNIITFICLLVICQTINSQNIIEIRQKLDSITNSYLIKSIKKSEKLAYSDIDITAEKWDNINFDPYRYEFKKQPFQIKFLDTTYASPVYGKKVVTSHYGWRRGRAHKGIDIDLVTGDSVRSMFSGIVRFARYSRGHGRTVIVRHFNGLETAYAHLSKYTVKANDTVKKGQVIGTGGTSGNARGSHLHLTVSYKGNFINPEYVFDFSENNKVRAKDLWVTRKWVSSQYHTSKIQSHLDLLTTKDMAIASHKKDNQRKIHVVSRGDTLSGISSKYRVSLSKLCKNNAIRKTSVLKIGQKLIVNL
ncbi:hypothetical protein GCM10022291_06430 [Postechiella marina]|uniref:LysM domain-containing protein n=1 Tax=Postechiella marina TaxID=943941 RepID=A0ABP8C1W8_9FLAO